MAALAMGSALGAEINTRELVRRSIANGERAWEQSRAYSYLKRDLERDLDARGRVKSWDVDVYQVQPVGGSSYERLIRHGDEPLSAEQKMQEQRKLEARQRESPAQRARRLAKEKRERSFYAEIPDAFDFRLVGEENLPTGRAYVLEATPRPGFHPRSRYAHMFPKMRGKLWIDQKDVQWVKADAEAIDNVTFGFFIARLAKGSHIVLEQMRLPDGTWVPKHIQAKASARTMLVFNHNFEEDITYSDYRKGGERLAAKK